jgi:hypothetical protein
MSKKILAKTERFGILQQSKVSNHWSAPAAANAAFKLCQWINTGVLNANPDVQVDQFNVTSQNGIHSENERFFVDATSGLATVPFSGSCEKATMAPFLVSALQACSEAVGTPFEKTITAGGLTSTIDFAGNEGYLFTLAIDQGASADDGVIVENAIIDTLNIVWDLNARGVARLVSMSGTFKGNTVKYEQTLNGTWTNLTIVQTGFFNNTDLWGVTHSTPIFTVGGVDYSAECIRRVEVQINNNVTSNCRAVGGKANQYDIAPEYKVIVSLDYNDTTEKMLYDFAQGVTALMAWSNDAADAGTDGKWSFNFPSLRLMSPPKQYNGDYIGINLEMKCFSAAAATPLAIYYTDTVDYGF